jgi:putative acetyltransferase
VTDAPRIRDEAVFDQQDIRRLLCEAFGGTAEADLVDTLRAADALVLSLVAEVGGRIHGYAGFSRLKAPERALALAPLAVADRFRRRGLGAALVCEGLDRARGAGEDIVFVLGDPAYYTSFGFSLAAAEAYPCVYSGGHFMANRLGDVVRQSERVIYPEAFNALT